MLNMAPVPICPDAPRSSHPILPASSDEAATVQRQEAHCFAAGRTLDKYCAAPVSAASSLHALDLNGLHPSSRISFLNAKQLLQMLAKRTVRVEDFRASSNPGRPSPQATKQRQRTRLVGNTQR